MKKIIILSLFALAQITCSLQASTALAVRAGAVGASAVCGGLAAHHVIKTAHNAYESALTEAYDAGHAAASAASIAIIDEATQTAPFSSSNHLSELFYATAIAAGFYLLGKKIMPKDEQADTIHGLALTEVATLSMFIFRDKVEFLAKNGCEAVHHFLLDTYRGNHPLSYKLGVTGSFAALCYFAVRYNKKSDASSNVSDTGGNTQECASCSPKTATPSSFEIYGKVPSCITWNDYANALLSWRVS